MRISREGLTMVTVDDLTLDQVFEVSDTEITVDVYRRFDRDVFYATEISPESSCPINGIPYYEAAAFCNWLSSREGVPASDACYQHLSPMSKLMAWHMSPFPAIATAAGSGCPTTKSSRPFARRERPRVATVAIRTFC